MNQTKITEISSIFHESLLILRTKNLLLRHPRCPNGPTSRRSSACGASAGSSGRSSQLWRCTASRRSCPCGGPRAVDGTSVGRGGLGWVGLGANFCWKLGKKHGIFRFMWFCSGIFEDELRNNCGKMCGFSGFWGVLWWWNEPIWPTKTEEKYVLSGNDGNLDARQYTPTPSGKRLKTVEIYVFWWVFQGFIVIWWWF